MPVYAPIKKTLCYQSLLKTELTEVEMHYLEKLLSEERLVMGILSASQRSTHSPDALQ